MNAIKSFLKQNLQIILLVLCGVLVIAGILTVIFGSSGNDGTVKVLSIILGIVIVLLGLALALLAFAVDSRESANFFLYDQNKKSNISVDELDFDMVNKKMMLVMSKLTSSASKVWTEDVFKSGNEIFEDGDDRFVPLVGYKILYDLSERANQSVWNLYLMADGELISSIADAISLNGDEELAKAFKFLHENASGSYERTEKFLADNKKYIQVKMLKYVKANIKRF